MITRRQALVAGGAAAAGAAGLALVPVEHDASGARGPSADWGSVADRPEQRLTISWCGSPAYPSASQGTWVQRHVEKLANVRLRPIFMDWNGYQNRRPLMLCGGDVPDVCWDGDPMPVRRSIRQGFVLEVPYDVILRYAPTYVRNVSRCGKEAWLYSRYEGRNYGVPTFAAGDIYPCAMLWRMDWLRKVGLSRPPETLDEMHDALWRFRHKDPDGNGSVDTYGMCPDIHWSLCTVEVFSAFGVLPQDFILREGHVVWGGVQPEAAKALALLRQWYREELIDPDFATATATGASMADRKFTNGRTGYMYLWSTFADLDLGNPNSRYSSMRKLDPRVELAVGKPLIGFDGKRRARVWGGPGHVIWFGAHLAKEPEKVVRVLRLFERLATDLTAYVEARAGLRGVHWDWSPVRGRYLLPPYNRRGEDQRSLLHLDFESCYGFFSPCAVPLEQTKGLLRAGEHDFRMTYCNPAWGFRNVIGKSDVVPSAGRYLADLRQYQTTTYIEIIRGERPVSDFDEFVHTWRSRGGDTLTAEANSTHDELRAVMRAVGGADAEARP